MHYIQYTLFTIDLNKSKENWELWIHTTSGLKSRLCKCKKVNKSQQPRIQYEKKPELFPFRSIDEYEFVDPKIEYEIPICNYYGNEHSKEIVYYYWS